MNTMQDDAGMTGKAEALLRLVVVSEADGVVTLDALMVANDGDQTWPASGTPLALKLHLPESTWMAEALAELLRDWANENAVVDTTLVVGSQPHPIVRLAHHDSLVSLELVAA